MSIVGLSEQTPLHKRISQTFATMPPAEQRVATFLLRKGHEHADFSLAQLAELAGVSNAVVIRMCQVLGYTGFREFRLEWARIRARSGSKEESVPAVYAEIFHALRQSADLLSIETLERAATAILGSRQQFIYGSGGSSYVANLAAAAFNAVGRMSIPFTESGWQVRSRVYSGVDTTVLVISYRGYNAGIQRAVEADRDQGAQIITLTSDPGSELARMADIMLVTGGPAGPDNCELELSACRVVQLAVVHALVGATISLARKTGLDISRVEGHLYDPRPHSPR